MKTNRPPFFYVKPDMADCADLPVGAEFECVFAPEASTGDGWHVVRFRVALFRQPWTQDRTRGYTQISKTQIGEAMADRLWLARCKPTSVPVLALASAEGRGL